MISIEQRRILKELMQGNYIPEVKDVLKKRGVVSKNGQEYSDKMISHVFNGRYHNREIELAILKVYLTRKEYRKNWEKEKNRLLGIEQADEISFDDDILNGLDRNFPNYCDPSEDDQDTKE